MSALRRVGVVAVGGGALGAGAWAVRTGPDGIGLGVRDAAVAWAAVHAVRGAGR